MSTLAASLRAVPQVCSDRAIYLWAALATPPAAQFAHYLDPVAPIFKGQAAGVIVGLLGLIAATILWIPFQRATTWPKLSRWALALILVTWTYAIVLTQLDGSTFNLTAVAVPVVTILVLLKPPSREDVIVASLLFAYLIAAEFCLALVLGLITDSPTGLYSVDYGGSRFPLVDSVLHIHQRWAGPFGDVNFAGPIGGFLIVFGASLRSWNRVSLVVVGGVILILSQTRSAVFAIAAGLVVLLAYSELVGRFRRPHLARLALFVACAVTAFAYVLIYDPILNGRTDIWRNYLQLWSHSPWFGVGGSGVVQYVIEHIDNPALNHVHGHSVFIDTLARNGMFMLALFLAVLICTGIVAFRAAQIGQPAGLALLVLTVVGGIAETVFSMSYLSVNLVPLFIALFLSSSALAARDGPPLSTPSLSSSV